MTAGHKLIRNSGPRVTRLRAILALVALITVLLAATLSGLFGPPLQAAHATTSGDRELPVTDHVVLDISSGRVTVEGNLTPEDDGTD